MTEMRKLESYIISNTCNKYIEDRRHQIREVQKVTCKPYAENFENWQQNVFLV